MADSFSISAVSRLSGFLRLTAACKRQVCAYELNICEQKLVDIYRKLTPAQREAILGVMESYDT